MKSYILILFVASITSCELSNNANSFYENEGWRNWIDTTYNFSIKYPSNFEGGTTDIFYQFRSFQPDTLNKLYWSVERFHKSLYHSRLRRFGINNYTSTPIQFNGMIGTDYRYKEGSRDHWIFARVVQIVLGDFIYEVSTHIENDTLFDHFYKTIQIDTIGVKKNFKSLKNVFNNYLENPSQSELSNTKISFENSDNLKVGKEATIKINSSGYNKKKYKISYWTSLENTSMNDLTGEITLTPITNDSICFEVSIVDLYWGASLSLPVECINVK